ncbi:desulfoferrodoxin family protein [Anaerosporobacter faecicola]|uniref:desulfoferrodoxin family protein n=1 Tax=Anaerosporobacter faecicola TaxID=2718714 RepID=UPI00143BF462|nr:desulfoferrodoxin family protein [Anaerosporobacter faecicola]
MEQKFYVCEHCGNMVEVIKESGIPMMCCGQKMTELLAGTTDAAVEKHVPAYVVKDGKVRVKVGEVEHPMVEDHFIEWVSLVTNMGTQMKKLAPEQKPEAVFAICEDETVEAVYAYCNLHGLWKK